MQRTYYATDATANGIILPGNNSGIAITCDETTIIGNGTGYGAYGSSDHNITISGCDTRNYTYSIYATTANNWVIQSNNFTVPSIDSAIAISISNGQNSTIKITTLPHSASAAYGDIYLYKVNSGTIANNNLKSLSQNNGIYLETNSHSNNITGNNIYTNDSACLPFTLHLTALTQQLNTITLVANGTGSSGIYIRQANKSYATYNNVTLYGESSYGIYFYLTDNATASHNLIYANGGSSFEYMQLLQLE